jgi:hypothetical protein
MTRKKFDATERELSKSRPLLMTDLSVTRADDYRRKAEQADESAKKCLDVVARKAYEDIARQWRELAASVDRSEPR